MTLDDLERPKRYTYRNKKNQGAHQNEARFILSVAKCRSMIKVSRNIKYMRSFKGVPGEGHQMSNDRNGHALHVLMLTCALAYLRSLYVPWSSILAHFDRNFVT